VSHRRRTRLSRIFIGARCTRPSTLPCEPTTTRSHLVAAATQVARHNRRLVAHATCRWRVGLARRCEQSPKWDDCRSHERSYAWRRPL
jgi:hypothetical protein